MRTLPDRWHIKITEQNCNTLEDWRRQQDSVSLRFDARKSIGYFLTSYPTEDATYMLYIGSVPVLAYKSTLITFKEFEKLVLCNFKQTETDGNFYFC